MSLWSTCSRLESSMPVFFPRSDTGDLPSTARNTRPYLRGNRMLLLLTSNTPFEVLLNMVLGSIPHLDFVYRSDTAVRDAECEGAQGPASRRTLKASPWSATDGVYRIDVKEEIARVQRRVSACSLPSVTFSPSTGNR